jgi:hypothetical protein
LKRLAVHLVLSFSFLALFSAPSLASFISLARQLHGIRTPKQVISLIKADKEASVDPDIAVELRNEDEHPETEWSDHLRTMVKLRSLLEQKPGGKEIHAAEAAQAIKSMPLYRDSGVSRQSNWLQNAFERLKNLPLNFNPPSSRLPSVPRLGKWVTYLLWGVIGISVLTLLFLGLRQIQLRNRKKRQVKALLADSEPERTLDEWLALADQFESRGLYRDAVRALYLACLLKFDEQGVARFRRSETNWEHLARVDSSPNKPVELDFRSPTKAFDLIWYGHLTDGQSDVTRFRAWYSSVSQALASDHSAEGPA